MKRWRLAIGVFLVLSLGWILHEGLAFKERSDRAESERLELERRAVEAEAARGGHRP